MAPLLSILTLFLLWGVSFCQDTFECAEGAVDPPFDTEPSPNTCQCPNTDTTICVTGPGYITTSPVDGIDCSESLSCEDARFGNVGPGPRIVCAEGKECTVDCSGDPVDGRGSCQGATFALEGPWKTIKCSEQNSCAGATFDIVNPADDFVLECEDVMSCAGMMKVTLTYNTEDGAVEADSLKIKCKDMASCMDLDFDIANGRSNIITVELVECEDIMSCAMMDLSGSTLEGGVTPSIQVEEFKCEESTSCVPCNVDINEVDTDCTEFVDNGGDDDDDDDDSSSSSSSSSSSRFGRAVAAPGAVDTGNGGDAGGQEADPPAETGENIECTGTGTASTCADETIRGTAGNPIVFETLGCDTESCAGLEFNLRCADGQECTISCNGAKVGTGNGACEQSTFIISGPVSKIECDAGDGCQGATFTLTDPAEDFVLLCKADASCSRTELNIIISAGNNGDGGKLEFSGIFCEFTGACTALDVNVENNNPALNVEFGDFKCVTDACPATDVEFTGDGSVSIDDCELAAGNSVGTALTAACASSISAKRWVRQAIDTGVDESIGSKPDTTQASVKEEIIDIITKEESETGTETESQTQTQPEPYEDNESDLEGDHNEDYWITIDLSNTTLIQIWIMFGVIMIINCLLWGCCWYRKNKSIQMQIPENV